PPPRVPLSPYTTRFRSEEVFPPDVGPLPECDRSADHVVDTPVGDDRPGAQVAGPEAVGGPVRRERVAATARGLISAAPERLDDDPDDRNHDDHQSDDDEQLAHLTSLPCPDRRGRPVRATAVDGGRLSHCDTPQTPTRLPRE